MVGRGRQNIRNNKTARTHGLTLISHGRVQRMILNIIFICRLLIGNIIKFLCIIRIRLL